MEKKACEKSSSSQKMGRLLREPWERLPVWFFYLTGLSVLNMILTNVSDDVYLRMGIGKEYYAAAVVICYVWPFAYYLLRVHRSDGTHGAKAFKYIAFSVFLALPYLFVPLFGKPNHLSPETHRFLFEVSQLVWLVLVMIHSLTRGGAHRFITFFGVALLYGIILENGGIILGYFFEPYYRIYLWELPAPLCTVAGWSITFYCMIMFTQYFAALLPRLQKSVFLKSLMATGLALSLDLFFDPFASLKVSADASLFWHWNHKLPPFFLGEPILNWVAWFSVFFPFSFAYFLLERDVGAGLTPGRMNGKIFVYIPQILIVATVLNFGIMAILESGFQGPTFQILMDFWAKMRSY